MKEEEERRRKEGEEIKRTISRREEKVKNI